MNESRIYLNNKQLTKGQTATLFFVCVFAPALLGLLGCFLSGMTASTAVIAPFIPNGGVSAAIWTACLAFFGLSLFFALTADERTGGRRTLKLWSASLWGATFVLSLFWPFFTYSLGAYMLSFVWLVIIGAAGGALSVIDFKLRPSSAFLLIPFSVFFTIMNYGVFFAAINI